MVGSFYTLLCGNFLYMPIMEKFLYMLMTGKFLYMLWWEVSLHTMMGIFFASLIGVSMHYCFDSGSGCRIWGGGQGL